VIETNLGYQGGAAAGTGMVLTRSGEVLTNNHVIKGATTIRIVVPGTGRSYAAKVVGYDVSEDVALLQAQHASSLKPISLGDWSNLAVGRAVTAIGNAGGTGALTSATGTITGLEKTIAASDTGAIVRS
jgi:S1-C subfamily serine protease